MQIEISKASAADVQADALILLYAQGDQRTDPWQAVDEATQGVLGEALAGPAFSGKAGETLALPLYGRAPFKELVLGGLGDPASVELEPWRRAIAKTTGLARSRGARSVAAGIPSEGSADPAGLATATVEGAVLANYHYTEFKTDADDTKCIDRLLLVETDGAIADDIERAGVVCQSTNWARDLVNTPPNFKRPPALAAVAASMAAEEGLTAEVLDEERCRALGLNALQAVGSGSSAGPQLVVLQHRTTKGGPPPVLLVGKGITFDTGGISLKPSKCMDAMKADMSGAAAVLGTMRAVARLNLPGPLVGLIPLAENMPSADSYRPGDIVRAYGGRTIEIINTDAEGRLILADALEYGRQTYKPECIVDLATLTGACVVALGTTVAGLMSNDEGLTEALIHASRTTGEAIWQLPMWKDYEPLIESAVADVKNSGGRYAGAITAAKFLEGFVGDTPWAHLDIAGPAYLTKARPYQPIGGTGFGVRLLVQWLSDRAAK